MTGSSQHSNKPVAATQSSQILNQLTTYQLLKYLVYTVMKYYKFHPLQWLPTYYSSKFFETLPTTSDFKNPLGTNVVYFILYVIAPWDKADKKWASREERKKQLKSCVCGCDILQGSKDITYLRKMAKGMHHTHAEPLPSSTNLLSKTCQQIDSNLMCGWPCIVIQCG